MCWVFVIFIRFHQGISKELISGSILLLSTVSWGVAKEATAHYPTVELRLFRGLRV